MSGKRFASWPTYNDRKVVLDGDTGLRHAVTAVVDFGPVVNQCEETTATTTVTATWVTADTVLNVNMSGAPTADHNEDDAAVEFVQVYPVRITPGVGFDVVAAAPNGTWGRYVVNITG